jgi:hypothetical protein
MAEVVLTPQSTSRAGVQLTFSTPDVTDGIKFSNRSRNGILLVKNDSGSSINVTIDITKTLDGMTLPDRVVAVPAGEVKAFGPFPPIYENADKEVTCTFSAVADVGVALIVSGSLSV